MKQTHQNSPSSALWCWSFSFVSLERELHSLELQESMRRTQRRGVTPNLSTVASSWLQGPWDVD